MSQPEHPKSATVTDATHGNSDARNEFLTSMGNVVRDGFVTGMLALGSSLGLFELMATFKEPKTSAEIAQIAGYRERYVREWLSSLACARVIDVTKDGQQFFLPEHRHHALTGYHQENMAHIAVMLPAFMSCKLKLEKCFLLDGPLGTQNSDYTGLFEFLDLWGKLRRPEDLQKFFERSPGMIEHLESGIRVLEIGCGSGRSAFQLAKMFPKSTFISFDISEKPMINAESKARASKIDNLSFRVLNACEMTADWSNTFDLVFGFDVFHDIDRADLALAETHRVLKPGGTFMFQDTPCHSSLKDNLTEDQMRSLDYASSLFYCLPLSLTTADSLGLGACWGQERALTMLRKAGFKDPQIANEDGMDYLCIKD